MTENAPVVTGKAARLESTCLLNNSGKLWNKHTICQLYKLLLVEATRTNIQIFARFYALQEKNMALSLHILQMAVDLTEEVLEASLKYCGAVAVSAYRPYSELEHLQLRD